MESEQSIAVSLPVIGNLTYREVHAFINGLYIGYINDNRESEYTKEKHYWRAGYLFGKLIK